MSLINSTIPITVGGTLIQFPNSGSSPIWSEAVIQFAEAVATQLQAVISPFDISPTVQVLTSNANAGILLTGNGSELSFPSSVVRSFSFNYAIYRLTDSTSIADVGIVTGVYNTSTGNWGIEHSFQGDVQTSGQPWNTFSIDSSDRITLTTVALTPGTYNTVDSTISYSATTELVST